MFAEFTAAIEGVVLSFLSLLRLRGLNFSPGHRQVPRLKTGHSCFLAGADQIADASSLENRRE